MTDIAELFARDPMQHTKESIKELVDYYRERRTLWNTGTKSAGKAPAKKAPDTVQLDLSALGIKL